MTLMLGPDYYKKRSERVGKFSETAGRLYALVREKMVEQFNKSVERSLEDYDPQRPNPTVYIMGIQFENPSVVYVEREKLLDEVNNYALMLLVELFFAELEKAGWNVMFSEDIMEVRGLDSENSHPQVVTSHYVSTTRSDDAKYNIELSLQFEVYPNGIVGAGDVK